MTFLNPQEWFDQINNSINNWLTQATETILNSITMIVIDGMAIAMICFSIYYSIQIMCSLSDEKFNEYSNKIMITMVIYFCAKCASKLIGLG